MSPLAAAAASLAVMLALAGCARGKDEPVDPCPRVDAPARQLSGALLRQPVGTGLFELLPADGKVKRTGRLARLHLGDYTFRSRGESGSGGLEGRRGSRADPIPGMTETGFLEAYTVSYRRDGQDLAGKVVVGLPTPGSRLPTTGQAHYRGPVRLSVQDRGTGSPAESALRGTADVLVSFGSRQVAVSFDGFTADAAATPPFARLDWTGIGMCNVRLGSTGQGGFRMAQADGQVVNFAGPSAGSASGTAVLEASFYGFDAKTAQPEGIGGVLLIQGDAGLISGVFAAGPTN